MQNVVLVVHLILALCLVGLVLMQRSEGGGLGIGGSPSGMLSARGAADFLTRSTRWLAILFVVLSIVLAAMVPVHRRSSAWARRPSASPGRPGGGRPRGG